MEADFLRLILFLAGAALILGIYLFDRFKHRAERHWQHRDEQWDEPEPVNEAWSEERSDPYWEEESAPAAVEPPERFEATPAEDRSVDEDLARLSGLMSEEAASHRRPRRPAEQISLRLFGGDSQAQRDRSPPSGVSLPTKILQLNIVPRQGMFRGDDILCVVAEVDLDFGEMDVYHRYDPLAGDDRPIFSMANLVEPGTFPIEHMEEFATPGLTLFAMLPGPKDGLSTFSELLFTAERLATLLDGELQDRTHSVLSKQTIEHMREEIQEYHRQLQLARRKQ